jgi:hypothetical protein
MNAVKISLVVLAISFATFVSLLGYQSLLGVHDHNLDFNADTASTSFASTNYQGQTRTYYIAADEVKWDFAPTGINQITGKPFNDHDKLYIENTQDRIGKVYLKAQYR